MNPLNSTAWFVSLLNRIVQITLSTVFAGFGLAFPPGPLLADEDPPNIVFILTDNQGAWHLGCYGNPDFQTPHIDQLAAISLRPFAVES